ncbi:MAG: peptidylprolyl isomerase [Candidatus Methylomirabilis oxyfera]|nr:peptidylprolyl isomerase [Candidatus Methylomirabilis oxyfera]
MLTTRYVSILATMLLTVLAFVAWIVRAESPEKTAAKAKTNVEEIQKGSTVKIEYTLTDEKGKVLDTNKGKEPLIYTDGEGQIIPGLEKALRGLRAADQKRVVVPPEEAYGLIRPLIEVPKERIPPQAHRVGFSLMVRNGNSPPIPVKVKELREKTIVLDANHPLAGMSLTFDVKVIGVEPAQIK